MLFNTTFPIDLVLKMPQYSQIWHLFASLIPHFLQICHCFHPIGLRLGDFCLRYHAWVRLSELLQLEVVLGKSGHLHGLRSTIDMFDMCIYSINSQWLTIIYNSQWFNRYWLLTLILILIIPYILILIYQCLLTWYYQYQWLIINIYDSYHGFLINIYGLYQCLYQWIGLREKLQESPIFHGEKYGFLQISP